MSCTKLNVFLVAWGALEVVCFAGIVFGWASLVYVYRLEGLFSYVCEKPEADLQPVIDKSEAQNGSLVVNVVPFENEIHHPEYDENDEENLIPIGEIGTNISDLHRNESVDVRAVRSRHITCVEQDKIFNLIYTLAVVINGMSSFINGALYDKFGTTFMRVIGMLTYVPGLLMAAFASKAQPHLLYPAMILIAYGGYTVLLTNFQLANLIPKFRSTIISLYCGAYDSSAFVLVFIKLSYDAGIEARYVFFALLVCYSIVILSTFWYLPKARIPFPLPPNYKMTLNCRDPNKYYQYRASRTLEMSAGESAMSRAAAARRPLPPSGNDIDRASPEENVPMVTKSVVTNPNGGEPQDAGSNLACDGAGDGVTVVKGSTAPPQPSPDNIPFLKEMLTAMFIFDVVWLSLMRLQSWSFIGRLNPSLNRLANGDKDIVGQYTSVYAWMQFCGIFLAPLSGLLMDRKKGGNSPPQLKRIELIEVCIASFVIDNTAGLLLAISITIPNLQVQYASFVFSVLHRALLYGPNSAFIAQAFSSPNFGKLFGLAMTVSAAFSLIQYPLFILQTNSFEGDPFYFNMLMLVLMVVAYIHPLYIWRWCRQKRRQFVKSQGVKS